jgi:hypothetical protein
MSLPNFLIIGAAKAGTTSLYHYLGQHPDVFMSPIKEPNYFTDEDLVPAGAIRSRRDYERLFAGADGQHALGEATVRYLNCVAGVDRIHHDLPGVMLIVSLRQPADRAYSSYLGFCAGGAEIRSPEEALQPGNYSFEASFYYPRLRRYFDRFPDEQIKVILFDDLIARPLEVVRELFRFLHVDPDFAPDTAVRHNAAVVPRFAALNRAAAAAFGVARPFVPLWLRSKALGVRLRRPLLHKADPISPALRQRLTDQYRDDIIATGELIGRDLSAWLA